MGGGAARDARRNGLAPRAASVPTFLFGAAVTELRSPSGWLSGREKASYML
jgi:hypothetical protein